MQHTVACSFKLKLHPTPHSWVVTLRTRILNYFRVLKWTLEATRNYERSPKILKLEKCYRLRKYLSTFKKGFLDDTSYVGRFSPGLQSNCSVFSSKIHVHDPITEILIDWQHTTSLRRPKETLSYYCYTHILFPFFNPPSQKWLRLSCSLQRKYNVLDEFTTPDSNCLWKNISLILQRWAPLKTYYISHPAQKDF